MQMYALIRSDNNGGENRRALVETESPIQMSRQTSCSSQNLGVSELRLEYFVYVT